MFKEPTNKEFINSLALLTVFAICGSAAWATFNWFLSDNLWAMAGASAGYLIAWVIMSQPFNPMPEEQNRLREKERNEAVFRHALFEAEKDYMKKHRCVHCGEVIGLSQIHI